MTLSAELIRSVRHTLMMDAGVIQKTKNFGAHMAPEKVWGRVMSPACDVLRRFPVCQ
jgi:hypothetical protein